MSKKRSRTYCAAYGCLNKEVDPDRHFFRLPSNVERCKKWLELVGREDLLKKKDFKSYSYCICSAHFHDCDIETVIHKKLKSDALPSLNLYIKKTTTSTETQTEENEWSKATALENELKNLDKKENSDKMCILLNLEDITSELNARKRQTPALPTQDDPKPRISKKNMKCRLFNVSTQTNLTDSTIPNEDKQSGKQTSDARTPGPQRKRKLDSTKLENSDKKKCVQQLLDTVKEDPQKISDQKIDPLTALGSGSSDDDEFTKRFQKLIQWQNNMKKKQKRGDYDPEFKFFALNLYFSSPQIYQSLKTTLKLPSELVLQKYKLHIRPELDRKLLKCVSLKLQTLSDVAKYCTLCVGLVTLNRHVYYDVTHDDIIGLHNVNGQVKAEVASYAYVVMLRGIAVNWKQIIAYSFLARNEHYEELDGWINEIILQLLDLGIKVMAIVSDQAPMFTKYAKENKEVTTKKPYFTLNDHKIYYIFDIPNLLSSLRNDLLENDFFFDGERISWDYIETMFHHQNEQKLGLLPNVTMAHIEPTSTHKSQVKYAAQIFSQRVFGALNTFIYAEFLPEEARATADFIKPINDTFDVLNSNTLNNNNKYQRAFTLNEEQMEVLEAAKSMFKNMTAICPTTGTNNTQTIGTFENFQISIQAIILLSTDLMEHGLNHVFTRRLNHDALKTVIAAMEKKTKMPTVGIKFKRLFSKIFLSNMLKNSRTNYYQGDLCDLLLRGDTILGEPGADQSKSFGLSSAKVSIEGETDYWFDIPPEDAVTYVAGYLLIKCSEKHQCPKFETYVKNAILIKDSPYKIFSDFNKKFPFYKNFKVPPECFVKYVSQLENKFLNKFKDSLSKNPANTLLPVLREVEFQFPCSCFPSEYLLKLYVRFRIFATLKYNNKYIKHGKGKRTFFQIKPF